MYLTKLIVKNFRSLRDVTWEPGKLNVVIGPNASGKTNLVSVFEMLIAAYQRRLREYILDQGGMPLVAWDGREDVVGLEFWMSKEFSTSCADAYFRMGLIQIRGHGDYVVVEEEAGRILSSDEKEVIDKTYSRDGTMIGEGQFRGVSDHNEAVSDFEVLLPAIRSNMLKDGSAEARLPIQALQDSLQKWRVYTNFDTNSNAQVRQTAITRYEKTLDSDGNNLVAYLHTLYSESQDFRQDFDSAMRAAFNNNYEELVFAPASDRNIQLRVRWKGQKESRSTRDLSEGTLRFMYLIGVLADPNLNGLVVIEEPETGLHPSMFGIVAEFAATVPDGAQVVLTTHSTDFLHALHEHKPTVTVTQLRDGETRLRTIAGDELEYWLKVYRLGDFHLTGAAESLL